MEDVDIFMNINECLCVQIWFRENKSLLYRSFIHIYVNARVVAHKW